MLAVAFLAVLSALVGSPETNIRKLALAISLVILWAALPALGLQR